MKKYKLWEVIKMMAEDRDLQFTDGDITLGSDDNGILILLKAVFEEESLDDNVDLDSEWELVKKSVTFDEALESGKKVRCEHEFILEEDLKVSVDEWILNRHLKDYREGKFLYMTNMLFVLSWIVGADDIKQVIKEGKWYLED